MEMLDGLSQPAAWCGPHEAQWDWCEEHGVPWHLFFALDSSVSLTRRLFWDDARRELVIITPEGRVAHPTVGEGLAA